jgi:hypothetical protein
MSYLFICILLSSFALAVPWFVFSCFLVRIPIEAASLSREASTRQTAEIWGCKPGGLAVQATV